MLKDIIKVSQDVLNHFLFKDDVEVYTKINLYDLNRSLDVLVSKVKLVADHYLVLNFEEDFLQNSHYGEPVDKWRHTFNEDIKELEVSTKSYLLKLSTIYLCDKNYPDDREDISVLGNFYPLVKYFYSFVSNDYSCGSVKEGTTILNGCVSIPLYDALQYDFLDKSKFTYKEDIDLSTYDKRKAFQKDLHNHLEKLEKLRAELKAYISKRFTLEDLLY